MSKKQDKIAVSKLERAGKLLGAGAKVGGNYIKHYAKKLVSSDVSEEELDRENAKDIYGTLSKLKGGPLKIAQMLSMGDDMLPRAYTEQFALAQRSVTPLSYPLIQRTFKKQLEKSPEEIFDEFSTSAVNAASIGQVHKGRIGDQWYGVKVQYPGVADSIRSDLRMVKPLAVQLMGVSSAEIDPYMKEVETKLLEETDYELEIAQSMQIAEGCASLQDVIFPEYLPELSGKRIITMTWIEGMAIDDWLATGPDQSERDRIGQILWDFYQFQIHELRKVHADPHPGNFLITTDNKLGVVDFGCMKKLPEAMYEAYLDLLRPELLQNEKALTEVLQKIELLTDDDTPRVRELVREIFVSVFELVSKPFHTDYFDFGDPTYFQTMYKVGEGFHHNKEMKRVSARGSKHFIYFNRTYFGLYQLLHKLKARVHTSQHRPEKMAM